MVYAGRTYTHDDSAALCKRVQMANDGEALDILVRLHDGLVWSVVNDCDYLQSASVSREDMAQCGRMGLIDAIRRYNPDLGGFSTYAVWYIFSSIRKEAMNTRTTVRIPRNMQEDLWKVYRSAEKFAKKSPCELAGCIAEDLQMSESRVVLLLETGHTFCHGSSLDVPVNAAGDNFLIEFVSEKHDYVDSQIARKDIAGWLDAVLCDLRPRERLAIELYYGLGNCDGMTFKEVGKELGVTPERARQIIARGLRTLRRPQYRNGRVLLEYFDSGSVY